MKYLDADRDPTMTRELVAEIRRTSTRRRTLLEVCGGHAQNILRLAQGGILTDGFDWLHGPACPLSVLTSNCLSRTLSSTAEPGMIVCVPGDLLTTPDGREALRVAQARGIEVRAVYSPLDALALARKQHDREVVVLAAGFETLAAAAAATVMEADRLELRNFFMESRLLMLEAAVHAALGSLANRTDGLLISGPVCAVTGYRGYEEIARRFGVPVVVVGPEPMDLLEGLLHVVRQLERGQGTVVNQYARAARPEGNKQALSSIAEVFAPADADWRGWGRLPRSGLVLKDRYRAFDASARFGASTPSFQVESEECQDREILTARMKPPACRSFGSLCRPDHPLGSSMASSEGLCRSYYRYQRNRTVASPAPELSVMPAHVVPGT